jgi:phasin family protein
MNNPAEQIIAANKANMEAFEGAAKKAFAGAEKLVELNMAASKAALSESFSYAKAAMSAKTPQEFMTLQTGLFQPLAEKSTAYFQHVQSIATEGSADITKQIEANMADAQKAFGASWTSWSRAHRPVPKPPWPLSRAP